MNKRLICDEDLIDQYQAGNEACMDMLINRYKSKIFTAIQLVVNDRYIAEDIFQETFIKVIHTIRKGGYQENGRFLAWVIRIARNLSMDYFRKTKRLPVITASDGEDIFRTFKFDEDNKEEKTIKDQTASSLRDLIKKLPDEQKEVLILRHYGELSFKEIAEITNCNINTTLGRMRYALINLKRMIEEKSLNLQ